MLEFFGLLENENNEIKKKITGKITNALQHSTRGLIEEKVKPTFCRVKLQGFMVFDFSLDNRIKKIASYIFYITITPHNLKLFRMNGIITTKIGPVVSNLQTL